MLDTMFLALLPGAGSRTEFLEIEKRNSQPSDFSGDWLLALLYYNYLKPEISEDVDI